MLDVVVDRLKQIVSFISARLVDISSIVSILIVLLIIADVLLRRFFNAPIRASTELSTLGFSIIVFFPLAWAGIKDVHVEMDFVVNKFPKKIRLGVEIIILFLTTIMVGLMSWEIFIQGTKFRIANQETVLLRIPLFIFTYLAAFGSFMLALVFFNKFIRYIMVLISREER